MNLQIKKQQASVNRTLHKWNGFFSPNFYLTFSEIDFALYADGGEKCL